MTTLEFSQRNGEIIMKRKILLAFLALFSFIILSASICAAEEATENYKITDEGYVVYTDSQYQEVFMGLYNKTLENKPMIFGANITTETDFLLKEACDITIDLNGYKLKNTKTVDKSGDFDFQNYDAIIRIKNGTIESSFCVFIFRISGQLYAENLTVVSVDECIFKYGGHNAILSLKNCNMDATGNYYAINLDTCNNKGATLYEIEGGSYAGLCIHCPAKGSYVRDVYVYERAMFCDAWHAHGENNSAITLEIRNTVVDNEIRLNDRRLRLELFDCTYGSVTMTGGDQLITAYTSQTCDRAGTKTVYAGSSTGVLDEQYSIDHPALGHDNQVKLVYENGYMAYGYKLDGCTREGCSLRTEVEIEPLFTSKGYSRDENTSAIVFDYKVNKDAIAEYEEYLGTKISYGVVASRALEIYEGSPINSSASAKDGAVSVSFENNEYSLIQLKLTSITAKDDALYCCGYFIINGEVSYLNGNEISSSALAVSYNSYTGI